MTRWTEITDVETLIHHTMCRRRIEQQRARGFSTFELGRNRRDHLSVCEWRHLKVDR